ncbi:MAG: helix-turn-helix transcriptional regulator [Clostridia bacterium]|nr:helix-turn-helix transcriptional regulator [Clostridia bacterium]
MLKHEPSYFRSKIFKQLFLSYVLIIAVFLAVYTGIYLVTYSSYHEDMTRREMQQQAASWGMAMDQQLLSAQSVCAAVNTSENCRSILQTAYVEKKTIDSMQLYKMLAELRRIKGSTSNMNVYGLILSFQGDNRLYTAGSVISVSGQADLLPQSPYVGVSTVSELLGVSSSNLMLNKQYLIYADDYTAFNYSSSIAGSPAKGAVLVLLEQSSLHTLARASLKPEIEGYSLLSGDTAILSGCCGTDYAFTVDSAVSGNLRYCVYASPSAFYPPLATSVLLPVLALALLGLGFIALTYRISKEYYRPIGNIGQMIEHSGGTDEMDSILEGIRGLIGERNGYRERMVTITPYARQGLLHSLLSGDVNRRQLDVFTNEQFMGLRRACFMLAVVNVAGPDLSPQQYQDALDLITHACQELSTDECTIVCCPKNRQNLFVIAGSDDDSGLENLFYQLYQKFVEAIDDDRYAVTLGVSRMEEDLESLRDACIDAEHALEQMLTGGRRSVYFHDAAPEDHERRYFFPKDAHKRIVRDLKDGNLDSLMDILDEIYRRNLKEDDLPLSEVRLMADELHLTIRSALRSVYDLSTTHIQIERIRDAATIEEIFAYYRTVFATALSRQETLPAPGETHALEKDVCDYIEQNVCNPDLSLTALADRFGVSTKMIGLICKNAWGKTFLQHVRDRQIHRAVTLLKTTDASLEDIAQQCGFTNLLTFRRNFKAVMGMNPSDYRCSPSGSDLP